MFSKHHRLDNLRLIVDANGLQGFGRTEDVVDLGRLVDKFRAFGLAAEEIDGHDIDAIVRASTRDTQGAPGAVVARTTKGRGVSFMEDRMEWHYLPMTPEQYRQALEEVSRV